MIYISIHYYGTNVQNMLLYIIRTHTLRNHMSAVTTGSILLVANNFLSFKKDAN